MEALIIEATLNSPKIDFNPSTGHFLIEGKSYAENVSIVFKEALEFIKKYITEPAESTTLEFIWLYYNTSTSKIIIQIIQELRKSGSNFKVIWKCKKGVDVMQLKGEEIRDVLKVDLTISYI